MCCFPSDSGPNDLSQVDLGRYVPTNIKHHPSARVFGVALIHSEVEQEYGDEESSSYFRLYDERSLTGAFETATCDSKYLRLTLMSSLR
jgi:hypothetical protein